jgi:hypothetical protein
MFAIPDPSIMLVKMKFVLDRLPVKNTDPLNFAFGVAAESSQWERQVDTTRGEGVELTMSLLGCGTV